MLLFVVCFVWLVVLVCLVLFELGLGFSVAAFRILSGFWCLIVCFDCDFDLVVCYWVGLLFGSLFCCFIWICCVLVFCCERVVCYFSLFIRFFIALFCLFVDCNFDMIVCVATCCGLHCCDFIVWITYCLVL